MTGTLPSQLSVAVTLGGPGGSRKHCRKKLFVGQPTNTGGSVSLTVTVKEQLTVPATFVAVQVTIVVPTGNENGEVITVEPILHVTAGAGLPAAAAANASVRAHVPGVLLVVMFPGQVIVGGVFVVVTLTETVKVQAVELVVVSIAVQVTIVVPTGNGEPDAGAHVTVTPEQLSVSVGAG